jgi:lipopolysaccharide/colanic/teichoic acid biosynthesis glycosyltransferase
MGKNGKLFTMYKFRSMWDGAYDDVHRAYVSEMLTAGSGEPGGSPNAMFKLDGDDRITPIGAVLRKLSLDELPQLFNVVKGDMSLVGPRPALPWEAELFDRNHMLRFAVKPGLTGLWQVNGRSNMTMLEALDLDVRYAREKCTWLDLVILVRTVPVVLTGRGAA